MPSLMSKILYYILKKSNLNQRLLLEIDQNRLEEHPKDIPPARMMKKYHMETKTYQDQAVYHFKKETRGSQYAIFYIHGGAYVHGLSNMHYRFLESLIKQTGYDMIVPDYPLVPHVGEVEIYQFLIEAYHDKTQNHQEIIIMGDSAGGGLALGLAQRLTAKGYSNKHHLMLLSPWLDVSMENPEIDSIQDQDPILNREALKTIGNMYGQGLKLTDPFLSPLYGKFTGIDSIALWIGTRDILYADALALEKRIRNEDIEFKMYVHHDMLHTWMFFGIKESVDAIHEMVRHIKSLE